MHKIAQNCLCNAKKIILAAQALPQIPLEELMALFQSP